MADNPTDDRLEKESKRLIDRADKSLKRIRKLAAKPESRYFLVGPKKGPLTTNERLEKAALERNELKDRADGMRAKRILKSRKATRSSSR
jgi:hypothetical protein